MSQVFSILAPSQIKISGYTIVQYNECTGLVLHKNIFGIKISGIPVYENIYFCCCNFRSKQQQQYNNNTKRDKSKSTEGTRHK